MPATRSSLVAQAQTVRNETAEGANTAERVGALFEDLAESALLDPAVSMSLYVNPVTGNDTTGTGAEGAPFATYAKARSVMGGRVGVGKKVRIYMHPQADGALYTEDAFWDFPEVHGVLEIIGVGTTPKDGTVYTASSVDTTNRTITLSASPTVTSGDLSGWQIEVVSSAGVTTGRVCDVMWNIGAVIYVNVVPFRNAGAGATFVTSGATFRFVEPTTRISTAGISRGSSLLESRSIDGGRGGCSIYTSHSAGELRLINLQFYAPDNDVAPVKCTGSVRFSRCVQTQNASTGQTWEFANAAIASGLYIGSSADAVEGPFLDQFSGSGFCTRARVPATYPIRPGLNFRASQFNGGLSVGQTMFEPGCLASLSAGSGRSCFDAIGRSSGFPHSALYTSGCHLYTGANTSTNGLWMRAPVGGWDLEVNYCSAVEINIPIRHVGTGSSPVRVRHHGFANFGIAVGGQPVVEDVAFTTGLTLQYGAQVRLINTDGASFKSASVGQNAPTVRNLASSPMVAATEVTGSEFCCLHRSA